jgi:hypothetical protein
MGIHQRKTLWRVRCPALRPERMRRSPMADRLKPLQRFERFERLERFQLLEQRTTDIRFVHLIVLSFLPIFNLRS